MRSSLTVLTVVMILAAASVAFADVPTMINYQGQLTDDSGNLLDTTVSMEFTIYNESAGGVAQWWEVHPSVTGDSGLFSVILGTFTPIDDGVFVETTCWLGIKVGSDDEISPRTKLTSVAYAHHALRADTAGYTTGTGWVDDGTVVRLDAGTDEVGVGTVAPDAKLHVESAQTNAGRFTSSVGLDDSAVFTAEYLGGGPIDAIAVRGISRPNDFFGIGARFEANYLGLEAIAYPGSTDPSYTYLGLAGKAEGGNARNFGVRADAGNCAQATGIYGRAYHSSEFAIGVNGAANVDSSVTASGVMGTANTASTFAYGVNGISLGTASTWNYGVYGEAHGSSTANIGVGGSATGDIGWKRAVYGTAGGTGDNYGVYGAATDASGTNNYGVYGTANSASGLNWAGKFVGDVDVTGTLSKAAGSFKIDHPLDPEHKYLQHSFVESPDMMNVYNGNVTTDASGRVVVELPNYFDALNRDFRYQLTVIGTFAQAIIEQEIKGNQFVIATDQPNVKVSWQVTGIRKDRFAEANRIQVELDKPAHALGKYRHPELYGFGPERGIDKFEEVPENEQLEQIARQQSEGRVK